MAASSNAQELHTASSNGAWQPKAATIAEEWGSPSLRLLADRLRHYRYASYVPKTHGMWFNHSLRVFLRFVAAQQLRSRASSCSMCDFLTEVAYMFQTVWKVRVWGLGKVVRALLSSESVCLSFPTLIELPRQVGLPSLPQNPRGYGSIIL